MVNVVWSQGRRDCLHQFGTWKLWGNSLFYLTWAWFSPEFWYVLIHPARQSGSLRKMWKSSFPPTTLPHSARVWPQGAAAIGCIGTAIPEIDRVSCLPRYIVTSLPARYFLRYQLITSSVTRTLTGEMVFRWHLIISLPGHMIALWWFKSILWLELAVIRTDWHRLGHNGKNRYSQ